MTTTIHNLPIEIIKEIFLQLSRHTHTHVCKYCLTLGKNPCRCWQLDLLTVALVCSHWYSIASHVIQITERIQPPWMQLLNLTGQQRSYPLRSKLINLLNESRHRSLFFHSRVRHLVIDFKTFGITEKPKLKKGNFFFFKQAEKADISFFESRRYIRRDEAITTLSLYRTARYNL